MSGVSGFAGVVDHEQEGVCSPQAITGRETRTTIGRQRQPGAAKLRYLLNETKVAGFWHLSQCS